LAPIDFLDRAKHYGIVGHIEASKSKGFHVWIFFEEKGVLADKARMVVRHILSEIGEPDTEVFPKQDTLNGNLKYGNFINTPLFGALVPYGKTVFIEPSTFEPFPDQWDLLESAQHLNESVLDVVIEINELSRSNLPQEQRADPGNESKSWYALPACAQIMLREGVVHNQRVSCFRLAVHFRRLGLPYDLAVAALKAWALKNRPTNGKGVIRDDEIIEQTSWAFKKQYRGYGCESEAIAPFCRSDCPVKKTRTMDE